MVWPITRRPRVLGSIHLTDAAFARQRNGGKVYSDGKSATALLFRLLLGESATKTAPVQECNGPAHGSKEASEIARYKAAVNRFLAGDTNALAPWHGKKIAGVELITDGRTLKGLSKNDLLPYSIYRSLWRRGMSPSR